MDACASPPPAEDFPQKRSRTVEDFNQFCTFVLAYAGYIPYPPAQQDPPVWSGPSPPNSTGGTADSDGGEPRFGVLPAALSLLGKPHQSFGVAPQLRRQGKPYADPWTQEEEEEEEEEAEARRRKRRRRRRPADMLDGEGAWDSDTPSSASDPPGDSVPVPGAGKRTIVRQGKQVVFRDEDGSWDDEDIMVDSDDDSWDLVTCFCRKPFAGRPMIECGECHTWVHLSCAKIRAANVPEVYACQGCRGAGPFGARRSSRSRMGSRRRFLD